MSLASILALKREHALRLANQNGSAGEAHVFLNDPDYIPRPKGPELANLIAALAKAGTAIKKSSFDAIALPKGTSVDFSQLESIRKNLSAMTFVEIKTANQARVKSDFSGFFFAFTEGEIQAAEILGSRHVVLLVNKATGVVLQTSVREVLARAKSTNWQVSVQL